MRFRRFQPNEDIDKLYPIRLAWEKDAQWKEFGFTPNAIRFLETLYYLTTEHVLFVMEDNEEIKGLMGLVLDQLSFADEILAEERFFYVLPESRGPNSVKFLKYVIQQAKDLGADQFCITASHVASNKSDKVAKLYERLGFKLYESTFIKEI